MTTDLVERRIVMFKYLCFQTEGVNKQKFILIFQSQEKCQVKLL